MTFEFFDASGTSDQAAPDSTRDLLRDLGRSGTEAGLQRKLDEVNGLVEEMSAKDRAEGAPTEVVALLEQITGADNAPLPWASLHRRVHAGVTTWDSFWLDPAGEEDGLRLISEVMRRSRVTLQAGLAQAREGR